MLLDVVVNLILKITPQCYLSHNSLKMYPDCFNRIVILPLNLAKMPILGFDFGSASIKIQINWRNLEVKMRTTKKSENMTCGERTEKMPSFSRKKKGWKGGMSVDFKERKKLFFLMTEDRIKIP